MNDRAILVLIERRILQDVLDLHAAGVHLTGDVIEPIRRAIINADRESAEIAAGQRKLS